MEQTRYWMLPGTRHAERPPIARPQITNPTSYSYESWEERAFAQDYSCVWPPRSYSCTFCRREFRSAQALGGHMNVHRRDRARLRSQPASTSPTNEETPQNYDAEFVPHVGSFLFSYNPNLNPNPNSNPRSNSICGALLGPPISTSGSSNLLRKGKWNDTGLVSLSYSSATMNEDKEDEIRLISSAQLAKEPIPTRKLLDLEEFVRVKDFGSSLMKRNFNDMNTDEHVMISKRRRVETIAPPLVVSIPFNKQKELDIEIVEICPSPLEELDLELRLGDAPKLKKIA